MDMFSCTNFRQSELNQSDCKLWKCCSHVPFNIAKRFKNLLHVNEWNISEQYSGSTQLRLPDSRNKSSAMAIQTVPKTSSNDLAEPIISIWWENIIPLLTHKKKQPRQQFKIFQVTKYFNNGNWQHCTRHLTSHFTSHFSAQLVSPFD